MASPNKYPWQQACRAVLRDPDSGPLVCRVEHAITALERRLAEWDDNPGTQAESEAIREAIFNLQTLLEDHLRRTA